MWGRLAEVASKVDKGMRRQAWDDPPEAMCLVQDLDRFVAPTALLGGAGSFKPNNTGKVQTTPLLARRLGSWGALRCVAWVWVASLGCNFCVEKGGRVMQ